jgi:hypothetical protein
LRDKFKCVNCESVAEKSSGTYSNRLLDRSSRVNFDLICDCACGRVRGHARASTHDLLQRYDRQLHHGQIEIVLVESILEFLLSELDGCRRHDDRGQSEHLFNQVLHTRVCPVWVRKKYTREATNASVIHDTQIMCQVQLDKRSLLSEEDHTLNDETNHPI